MTKAPWQLWHQNTWDSSRNWCLLKPRMWRGSEGTITLEDDGAAPLVLVASDSGRGVSALEGGWEDLAEEANSLSILALSIPSDTRRLCFVSGERVSNVDLRGFCEGEERELLMLEMDWELPARTAWTLNSSETLRVLLLGLDGMPGVGEKGRVGTFDNDRS